jgi:CheY-like chemotaxis protein
VLLLDEASSHLDLDHRLEMADLLVRLNRDHGTTVVQISHDLDTGCFALIVENIDVESLRKQLATCLSAFTPSVRVRTGAIAYDGEASFKQLLAGSMHDAATDVAEVVQQHANPSVNDAAGGPVYIVEDDGVLRTVLTEQFSRAGFDCRGYENGREALAAMLEADGTDQRPVVILDLDIPGIDGISLLEQLRSHRPDRFRALIMTADETEETELKGLRAGAHDYVIKPVKVPVMIERVRRLVA